MESLYSVKLGKLIQEFRLEVLRGGAGYEDVSIRTEAGPAAHRIFRLL